MEFLVSRLVKLVDVTGYFSNDRIRFRLNCFFKMYI